MDLGPWPLGETSKASWGLGTGPLGTEKGRLGLASRILGLSLVSSEYLVRLPAAGREFLVLNS